MRVVVYFPGTLCCSPQDIDHIFPGCEPLKNNS